MSEWEEKGEEPVKYTEQIPAVRHERSLLLETL